MTISPTPTPKTNVDKSLVELMEQLAVYRGTPEQWLGKENTLTKFIANLTDTTRVFCRGEYYHTDGHYPAVLTYDVNMDTPYVWVAKETGCMEQGTLKYFHSKVQHIGNAREVLMDDEGTREA